MKFDTEKSEYYKNQLISKFPDSEFSKVIINPNFRQESRIASEKLQKIYKIAYEYYLEEAHDTANYLISQALIEEPDNVFSDNLELLRVLILGKTDGIERYQFELDAFIKNNPESDILAYAQQLRSTSDDVKKEIAKRRGISYTLDFKQNHAFILLYSTSNKSVSENITNLLQEFLKKSGYKDYTAANLVYNKEIGMALIEPFKSKKLALAFLKLYLESDLANETLKGAILNEFVVSKENFETFYENKDHKGYQKFFNNHYIY